MKKIIALAVLLFIFLPSISFAESFKITSPVKGDTYYYGETINIEWASKDAGVQTIEIKSKNTKDSLGIYGEKVFGDPVNYKGYFDYELPRYLIVRPGEYYVKITLEDGREYKSKIFNLVSKDATVIQNKQTDNIKYSLGKFINTKNKYNIGDPITFSIQGFEMNNTVATPYNGFNIQAHVYKKDVRNPAIEAVNAVYDSYSENWDITLGGINNTGSYEIVVSLYCGNISPDSYCANKYGGNAQVEKTFKFNVIKNTNKKVNTITKEDHFLSGTINSPVKVLTYSDIECPYCKGFNQTTKRLIGEYGDAVAFVYRHYPLTQIHQYAESAANATECVSKIGGEDKFSEYLNLVFDVSPNLEFDALVNIAGQVGIQEKAFESCLMNKTYAKELKKDQKEGDKIAQKDSQFGTPYSIAYGPKNNIATIKGNQPYETIKNILDSLLKK